MIDIELIEKKSLKTSKKLLKLKDFHFIMFPGKQMDVQRELPINFSIHKHVTPKNKLGLYNGYTFLFSRSGARFS